MFFFDGLNVSHDLFFVFNFCNKFVKFVTKYYNFTEQEIFV